jgi:hypothetical protein
MAVNNILDNDLPLVANDTMQTSPIATLFIAIGADGKCVDFAHLLSFP